MLACTLQLPSSRAGQTGIEGMLGTQIISGEPLQKLQDWRSA